MPDIQEPTQKKLPVYLNLQDYQTIERCLINIGRDQLEEDEKRVLFRVQQIISIMEKAQYNRERVKSGAKS